MRVFVYAKQPGVRASREREKETESDLGMVLGSG